MFTSRLHDEVTHFRGLLSDLIHQLHRRRRYKRWDPRDMGDTWIL